MKQSNLKWWYVGKIVDQYNRSAEKEMLSKISL